MNRYEALKSEQAATHRRLLDGLASEVRREAQRLGVRVYFFGSYVDGRIDADSDLDIAISEAEAPEEIATLRLFIDRAASRAGVDVDIVIKERMDLPDVEFSV